MRPARRITLESEAAWTIATMFGGAKPLRRDHPGGPPGTHDFDIVTADGRVIALEVTSSTVPEVVQFWDTVDSLDWLFPELPRSWSVSLDAPRPGHAGASVRRFHHDAPALFHALSLEVDGRSRDYFGAAPDPSLSSVTLAGIGKLKALGVRSGGPIDTMPGNAAIILVGSVGPGGWTDGRSVNEAVARAADANVDKLRRAVADQRHLFVWVDGTDSASQVAMTTFSVPKQVPALPDRIDAVWVGLWMPGIDPESNAHSIWTVSPESASWWNASKPRVRSYAQRLTAD